MLEIANPDKMGSVLGADHLISGGGGGGVEENVCEQFIYFFPGRIFIYFIRSEKQIIFFLSYQR